MVDRAIAGGGEEVHPLIAAAFQALRFALATEYNDHPEKASRPYDVARDGFVLSGGAGIVVLEALDQALARGARVRAEIIGFGTSSDVSTWSCRSLPARTPRSAMRNAIQGSGIDPREVGAITRMAPRPSRGTWLKSRQ